MKINPKSKKFLVGMLLIFVNAFMCWWSLGTLIHARDTRSIANQLDAAVTQLQKGPQGAESAERFLAALKQIDAGLHILFAFGAHCSAAAEFRRYA
jgi:hypothetical protein